MNGRTTIALIIVAVIAIASFLLNRGRDDESAGATSDLPEGYYLKGVALTGTNSLGEVQFVLRAERVDHRPADGSIELDNIALQYGGDDSPWTMRAASGRMPRSNDEIDLSGDVRIESVRLNDGGPTTITSESLHVDIAGETARTSDPVRISVERGSLQGIGLEVDFANERVDILSDISGVFDPPPKQD